MTRFVSEAHLPREERLFAREVQQFAPRPSWGSSILNAVRNGAVFVIVATSVGLVIKLATVLPLGGLA